MSKKTYAFVDASNLFYGGEKDLGWKIDYLKLHKYLKIKYGVIEVYYFGGIEIHGYGYDYLKNDSVSLIKLRNYLEDYIKREGEKFDEAKLLLLSRHIQRIKFYLKLQKFGYKLFLKPVKTYHQGNIIQRKANCDVEMAFYLMKEKENFNRVVILSGDGDFLPLLKYLREIGKEVIILSRGSRTAREIKQFAGSNFRDFVRLENELKFSKK
ncbi:MAG TPA: NYN domain-containing protein [Patescibacteria group bacterium]|jgi:uncharacterized LabA/DUF88 family protein|nr:NYN domain-containing protein [Patescibacteria group bacterium]